MSDIDLVREALSDWRGHARECWDADCSVCPERERQAQAAIDAFERLVMLQKRRLYTPQPGPEHGAKSEPRPADTADAADGGMAQAEGTDPIDETCWACKERGKTCHYCRSTKGVQGHT